MNYLTCILTYLIFKTLASVCSRDKPIESHRLYTLLQNDLDTTRLGSHQTVQIESHYQRSYTVIILLNVSIANYCNSFYYLLLSIVYYYRVSSSVITLSFDSLAELPTSLCLKRFAIDYTSATDILPILK